MRTDPYCHCGCGTGIEQGRAFVKGYHLRLPKSKETILKIAQSVKSAWERPEIRQKYSGKNHHQYNKPLSFNQKLKIGVALWK